MPTTRRVSDNTKLEINQRIQEEIERRVDYYSRHPEGIYLRLRELDEEWDIERTLETNSAALSLFGLVMAITAGRRWLLLPLAVQSFFLQHALQGWCPPLPLLRRLGFRTIDEINYERYALKVLRGDFDDLDVTESPGATDAKPSAQALLQAVTH